MLRQYQIPVTLTIAQKQLKAKFMEHRNVKDIRIIDMLVIKVWFFLCVRYVRSNSNGFGRQIFIAFL